MKKLILLLVVFTAMVTASFAVPVAYNESSENNWSEVSYEYIPVYKVYESPDGYAVSYQKGKYGLGTTVLPKSWVQGNKDNPKKLILRATNGGKLKPFMTVVKKGGEFHHVILTMPAKKSNPAWGVVGRGTVLDTNKDTMESLQE